MSERRARDIAFAQFLRLIAHLVRKHRDRIALGYLQQLVEKVAFKLTVECCSIEDVFFALESAHQSRSVLDDAPLRPDLDPLDDEPTPVRRPRGRGVFNPFP